MRNRSIKFKLALLTFLMLLIAAAVSFLAVRYASGVVLRSTIRNYLIGMVEENTNKIAFITKEAKPEISIGNMYIEFEGGYLEIDDDFLDKINDVSAALYDDDGTMIYGENTLEKYMEKTPFAASKVWSIDVAGEVFDVYDRQLNLSTPTDSKLWIRGIVSRTNSTSQLNEITRLSLFVIPILILLLIFIMYFIIDRLLSPLGNIEKTAEQISEGYDLKRRIEVGKNNDEVSRLAKIFNGMLDRLERAFNTERQFTSDASHELRTPTSVIMTQAEYTLEKERSVDEYIDAMKVIDKQSKRMNLLLGDMLDYTRMDQKSERYEMEELDISRLVTETSDHMTLVGEKNIHLTVDVEPWLKINGNEVLLTRMIQNLISNAYRYGVQDGNIKVALKRVRDDESDAPSNLVELSIVDDGIGISKEDQEKIFDRFYQSDASRSIQGTGLGLSMVKKIVELHHGEIQVESEEKKGSTFRVRLPLCN